MNDATIQKTYRVLEKTEPPGGRKLNLGENPAGRGTCSYDFTLSSHPYYSLGLYTYTLWVQV